MDVLARDSAVLAGSMSDLLTLTVHNLRPHLDAQLAANPTWTAADLVTWFLQQTGVPEELLSENYLSSVADIVDMSLALP